MASAKKKKTGLRAALVVVLCLVLIAVVAAAVAVGLVGRRVKALQAGATFDLDYTITSTAAEPPTLYQLTQQLGGTAGHLSGQYAPDTLQLSLYTQQSTTPFTRMYISGSETLYDVGQIYSNLRASIVDAYPLSSLLLPTWSLGNYISQTQLASVLGVDTSATALQDMTGFSIDLKQLEKVTPDNAKDGYLYFRLKTDAANATAPVLVFGFAKDQLLQTTTPVHLLLTIPDHEVSVELTGTVTAAQTTVAAPTSRMQDSDIEALIQLRETIQSVLQFVQTAAGQTNS